MKTVVDILKEVATGNPDGFTFCLRTQRTVRTGIAVAHIATQNSFGFDAFPAVVAHANAHHGYVGGWRNEGLYYLDSVRLFAADELEQAMAWGRANQQLSIFHLTEQRVIFL